MVWLDFIFIILICIVFIGGIILACIAYEDNDTQFFVEVLLAMIFAIGIMVCMFFLVLDKSSGITQGKVTSVDKNFFGTTALYLKTSETEQEKYCIEDEELAKYSQELIGKDIKIYYGKRVGLYSVGKCRQSPIEKIEVVNNE